MSNSRMSKLQKRLSELKIDAFLITNMKNIYYLTGFTGDSGILFVTRRKALLITDYRFQGDIVENIKDADFTLSKERYTMELVRQKIFKGKKTIGFESASVSYGSLKSIKKVLKKKMKPIEGAVEELREIKDEKEITYLKKAASIGDKALLKVLDIIKPGIKEKDIAAELEYQMKKLGGEKPSFDTIVASGYRSGTPHGVASDKKIRKNEFITMDFGNFYKGYASDMTRTIYVGKPSKKELDIYNTVYQAQKEARTKFQVGMKLKDIDKIARDYITAKGYGENFTHSLGHGVGLNIHEKPFVSFKSKGVLKDGMVFTIEPGIYINNFCGVRIEDTVAVFNGKKIELTKSKRELITL